MLTNVSAWSMMENPELRIASVLRYQLQLGDKTIQVKRRDNFGFIAKFDNCIAIIEFLDSKDGEEFYNIEVVEF